MWTLTGARLALKKESRSPFDTSSSTRASGSSWVQHPTMLTMWGHLSTAIFFIVAISFRKSCFSSPGASPKEGRRSGWKYIDRKGMKLKKRHAKQGSRFSVTHYTRRTSDQLYGNFDGSRSRHKLGSFCRVVHISLVHLTEFTLPQEVLHDDVCWGHLPLVHRR